MKYALGNFQEKGAREEQQDTFGFSDPRDRGFVRHGGVVAALVDGMGGMQHGAAAAQTAVQKFLSGYRQKPPHESIPTALRRSLQVANRAVLDFARQVGTEGKTGATLVAAALDENRLYWISAGDSRAYLVRDGDLYQLTADHTYGAKLDAEAEAGKIHKEEALHDPERDSLTSFLGMPDAPTTDFNSRPYLLKPGDQVLLSSDGLYRVLKNHDITSALTNDLQAACERLVGEVMRRQLPDQDNITVVMMAPTSSVVDWPRFFRRSLVAVIVIDILLWGVFTYQLGLERGRRVQHPQTLNGSR